MAVDRNRVAGIALGSVVCLAVGVGVGLLVAPTPVPDVIEVGSGPAVVDVVAAPFEDSKVIQATPAVTSQVNNTTNAFGIVRSSVCSVGGSIASGQVVLTVDDRVVVALFLESPPYRDLARGVNGSDVTDLQRELNRLGFTVPTDGSFGASTAAAAKAFWGSLGVANLDSIPLDRMVWIDAATVTPSVCLAQRGQSLAPGAEVFTTGGHLTSLSVNLADVGEVHARVAVVSSGETAPIDENGLITDAVFLAAFQSTNSYRQWISDPSGTVPVTTKLTEPVQAVGVPPSALYEITGGRGCVIAEDGQPRTVQIMGSQLGQTFVIADQLPSAVSAPAPPEAASCR